MTHPRRLTAVAGTSKQDKNDYRCRLAVQAVLEGMQGPRPGRHPAGRTWPRADRQPALVYINDRDALDSLLDAWRQAADLGDKAFGVGLGQQRPQQALLSGFSR